MSSLYPSRREIKSKALSPARSSRHDLWILTWKKQGSDERLGGIERISKSHGFCQFCYLLVRKKRREFSGMIHWLTRSIIIITTPSNPSSHPTTFSTSKVIALGKTTHIFTGFWRFQPSTTGDCQHMKKPWEIWSIKSCWGQKCCQMPQEQPAACHCKVKKKRYSVDVAKALNWRQEKGWSLGFETCGLGGEDLLNLCYLTGKFQEPCRSNWMRLCSPTEVSLTDWRNMRAWKLHCYHHRHLIAWQENTFKPDEPKDRIERWSK